MGQSLGIGIRHSATILKKFIDCYPSEDEACAAFESCFNIVTKMYDKEKDSDGDIVYTIKSDIVNRDLKPMIKDFYKERYPEENSRHDWAQHVYDKFLAFDNYMDFFEQGNNADVLASVPTYDFIKTPKWNDTVIVPMRYICFSLDGKFYLETYGGIFEYLTKLVRSTLCKYELSQALFVNVVG